MTSSSSSSSSLNSIPKNNITGLLIPFEEKNMNIPLILTSFKEVTLLESKKSSHSLFIPYVTNGIQAPDAVLVFANQLKKVFNLEELEKNQKKNSANIKTLPDLIGERTVKIISGWINQLVVSLCSFECNITESNLQMILNQLYFEDKTEAKSASLDKNEESITASSLTSEDIIDAIKKNKKIVARETNDYDFEYLSQNESEAMYTIPLSVVSTIHRLCKKKIDESLLDDEKTMFTFFNLFYLFQALSRKYPFMISLMNDNLKRFQTTPQNRHKSVTPDLGEMFISLLLTSKMELKTLFPILLEEILIRNSLWGLRKFPELSTKRISNCYRITKSFEASSTSYRIILLFSYLYSLMENGKTRPRDRLAWNTSEIDFDSFMKMGTTSNIIQDFQTFYPKIWMSDFKEWFELLNIEGIFCPSAEKLSDMLFDAQTISSNDKHYHKHKKFFVKEEKDDTISKLPRCCCGKNPCLWS